MLNIYTHHHTATHSAAASTTQTCGGNSMLAYYHTRAHRKQQHSCTQNKVEPCVVQIGGGLESRGGYLRLSSNEELQPAERRRPSLDNEDMLVG